MLVDVVFFGAHLGLLVLSLGLFAVVVVLLTEICLSLWKASVSAPDGAMASCSYVVVIPAHNEVGTIETTLQSAIEQLDPRGRLLVVADNCTDETAKVSAAAGADVITRTDPSRRGKGYALEFAARHLASAPPKVVIVLDADCIAEDGAINSLVAECQQTHRPVQARYTLETPQSGWSLMSRVGGFAWYVKNIVRPSGLANAGLPCLLMGTGMALPWSCFAKGHTEAGHLVEDMLLGLELASAGYAPVFLPWAGVRSAQPMSHGGQLSQRTRWETGHLDIIIRLVPRFLLRSLYQRNVQLFVLTLHCAVPPLALLGLLLCITLAASGALVLAGGSSIAFFVAAIANCLAGLALIAAWHSGGRQLLSVRELLMLPMYALSKVPIYVRALAGKNLQWIRTERN